MDETGAVGSGEGGSLFHALFRSPAGFAIIGTDGGGRITGWNAGAEALMGWTAAEVMGRACASVLDAAGAEAGPVSQAGIDERWHVRKDGSRFWGRGETVVLEGADGGVLGTLLLLRDRTGERAQAEEQRRDAAFMRRVLGASDDCIKVLDLDGGISFMSEGGLRVMEVADFEAIRGSSWPDMWEDAGAAWAALRTAREGRSGRFQGSARTLAGNRRFWDVQVAPIPGADGAPERILSVSRDITSIQSAERALGEMQGLNTLILNSSRDCIVVLDLEGHTVFVSPGGIAAMEVTDVDAIIGLSWLRVWSDRATGEAARAAVAAARAGGVGRFKGFCPTHAGTPKWWDVVISPLAGPDGRPERLVSVGRDITDEVQAWERLGLSEESLRLAVDAADVGTWDLDMRTDVLVWTDRTRAMFGISPGVPCRMEDFYAGLHPEDREATSVAFATALDPARRATYDVEYRTVGKEDGVVRWVAARGRALFDAEGSCVRALGTAIDISARKFAESRQAFRLTLWDRLQALSDPTAMLACAAEALCRYLGVSRVGYGLVQADGETVVLDASHVHGVAPLTGSYRLSDFGEEAIAQNRLGLTVRFDDVLAAPGQDPGVWAAIDTRAVISVPLVRGGRFRASLYVNDVAPRAWTAEEVALTEDVARRTWDAVERARAEAALREANELLEHRVATALEERHRIEETLRQSQKMEAVGQLTGGLAHDFNNLLAGISGSLELMQVRIMQGRTSDLDRFLVAAQGAARRAAALTHRLLAFSRRQTLDPKATDLNRLVSGMEDLVRRSVGPGVHVEVVGAGGLWMTMVDPPQLENALLNLCINARDAMPDGGRLTIETANRWMDGAAAAARGLPPGQYVSLCVTDTGTGMTPEVAARAFDPFYTTKPIGQGTGLGLSMIYGFVQQSGGQVRIHTEVGQGTTMCIYLPRHHGAEAEDEVADGMRALPRAVQGETVLVVDDEPTVRMLVSEVLGELGYTAIETSEGQAALRVLQSAAVRPRRMVVAAARGPDRRSRGAGQNPRRARCGQSKGTRIGRAWRRSRR